MRIVAHAAPPFVTHGPRPRSADVVFSMTRTISLDHTSRPLLFGPSTHFAMAPTVPVSHQPAEASPTPGSR